MGSLPRLHGPEQRGNTAQMLGPTGYRREEATESAVGSSPLDPCVACAGQGDRQAPRQLSMITSEADELGERGLLERSAARFAEATERTVVAGEHAPTSTSTARMDGLSMIHGSIYHPPQGRRTNGLRRIKTPVISARKALPARRLAASRSASQPTNSSMIAEQRGLVTEDSTVTLRYTCCLITRVGALRTRPVTPAHNLVRRSNPLTRQRKETP
jgi:hypothetical protein